MESVVLKTGCNVMISFLSAREEVSEFAMYIVFWLFCSHLMVDRVRQSTFCVLNG